MPRWMPMTKLLPIIPAFGVCFAGGMLLHPAAADRAPSLRVLSQVQASGDAGYAAWKAEAEKAEIERGKLPQEASEAKELSAKADEIRELIGEIDAGLRDKGPQVKESEENRKWTEMVRQDPAYKRICETKEKLDQVTNEKEMLKDMALKERKAWRTRYEAALKAHDDAMSQNLEKLKALRAKDPRGAGK